MAVQREKPSWEDYIGVTFERDMLFLFSKCLLMIDEQSINDMYM